MLLFGGEEHVDRWCKQWNQAKGATLTIDQGWQLARRWYQHKMEPDWQRLSLEQTEALLAELGLSGPFWSLR